MKRFNDKIDRHYRANYGRLVKQQCRYMSKVLAEDAVQEAYTRALEHADSYNKRRSFNAWFQNILFASSKDLQKRERNRGMTFVGADETVRFYDIKEAYNLSWDQ